MEHGHDATLDFLSRRIDRTSWCGEQQKVNAGGYAVYIQRIAEDRTDDLATERLLS